MVPDNVADNMLWSALCLGVCGLVVLLAQYLAVEGPDWLKASQTSSGLNPICLGFGAFLIVGLLVAAIVPWFVEE